MEYTDFGLKKIHSIHHRLAIEINKGLQKTEIPEWMRQIKDQSDPE